MSVAIQFAYVGWKVPVWASLGFGFGFRRQAFFELIAVYIYQVFLFEVKVEVLPLYDYMVWRATDKLFFFLVVRFCLAQLRDVTIMYVCVCLLLDIAIQTFSSAYHIISVLQWVHVGECKLHSS